MTRHMRRWVFAFILVGMAASAASLYVQSRMVGDPSYASFCNVGQVLNCDVAYQSRFARFHNVPVALIGMIWFTLTLLLTLADDPRIGPAESGAAAYLFLASIPALSVMLLLAYASLVVVRAVCIPCALAGLAVAGIFLIAAGAPKARLTGVPRGLLRDVVTLAGRPIALGVAMLFVAGSLAALAFFPRPLGDAEAAIGALMSWQSNDFDLWLEDQQRVSIALPADGAEVHVVEFADYQCAVCGQSHKANDAVLERYEKAQPGKVRLIMKDYPLDPDCNPYLQAGHEFHQAACESAAAVRLATLQQRGAAMQDWLYGHQSDLSSAAVRKAAKEIGGVDDFDNKFPLVVPSIQKDIDLGHQLRLNAMPTLFINGVRIEGVLKPELLDRAIAHELKVRAKK